MTEKQVYDKRYELAERLYEAGHISVDDKLLILNLHFVQGALVPITFCKDYETLKEERKEFKQLIKESIR